MINTVVARRYANAIFALSETEGDKALAHRGECLANLSAMIAASPGLDLTLKSPVVSIEEKKAVVGKLLAKIKADNIMQNFCFLLADKERLAFLREIATLYGELLDEKKGVVRGRVTTAISLSPEDEKQILNAISTKKSGREVKLEFAVDASILGGMVLQMGDKVWDASLQAQLSTLRETFKRGE
ncbi:MAG: F0F1 ATP synthase subunit delta [Desulfovibrionaceae bacterium]|nr:F0F1 ATP synthase subunit delta [Desulfovibrionaceae bacterium]